ncbi:DUF7079 family protein [Pseudomonas sp. ABY48]|uniref:DUF7079 family protein n=1 Tax=Pseudomonas sp. ABY48 TaxID=3402865 RepID=UPI003B428CD4
MNPVDSNRLKTWQALSSLFLDTEIDDLTYDYIARVVLETNYSPKEIHSSAIQGAVSLTPVTPAICPTFFSVRRKLGSRKGLPQCGQA